ncbi:MAG: hypothetical protein ACTHLP_03985, partial [Rhizobiaceae bacterium]
DQWFRGNGRRQSIHHSRDKMRGREAVARQSPTLPVGATVAPPPFFRCRQNNGWTSASGLI